MIDFIAFFAKICVDAKKLDLYPFRIAKQEKTKKQFLIFLFNYVIIFKSNSSYCCL